MIAPHSHPLRPQLTKHPLLHVSTGFGKKRTGGDVSTHGAEPAPSIHPDGRGAPLNLSAEAQPSRHSARRHPLDYGNEHQRQDRGDRPIHHPSIGRDKFSRDRNQIHVDKIHPERHFTHPLHRFCKLATAGISILQTP